MEVSAGMTIFLAFLVAAWSAYSDAEENKMITSGSDIIQSPGYPTCRGHAKEMTWTFSPEKSSLIILNFIDFHISPCSQTRVAVEINHDFAVYCDKKNPSILYSTENIEMQFEVDYGSCGRGFNMRYTFSEIVMQEGWKMTSSRTVIRAYIPKFPPELTSECTLEFVGRSVRFSLTSKPTTIGLEFTMSGIHKYFASCNIKKKTQTGNFVGTITSSGIFVISDEIDVLQRPIQWPEFHTEAFGVKARVELKHRFLFPVTYHLAVGSEKQVIISKVAKYTKQMMKERTQMTVEFEISNSDQQSLGPGMHEMLLMLENEISSVTVKSFLALSTKLSRAVGELPKYVGMYPSTFPVTVKIADGCPAYIQIIVSDSVGHNTVGTYAAMCNNTKECRDFSIDAFVGSPGIYDVTISANNSLETATSFYGPIESFHLVYDVFVTSKSVAHVDEEVFVFVFYKIRSGGGIFQIALSSNGKPFFNQTVGFGSHETWKNVIEPARSLVLPFDPSNLNVLLSSQAFPQPGNYEIVATVTTRNGKVTLESRTTLQVLLIGLEICLSGVKIRDGHKGNINNVTLRGGSTILLTASVEMKCGVKESEIIAYKWSIHKVDESSEAPKKENEISVDGLLVNRNELVIRNLMLSPGLYMIKSTVGLFQSFGSIIHRLSDSTTIQVDKPKLDAQICGGYEIEIGQDATSFTLDASCSLNPPDIVVEYRWFCALTEADLPQDKYVGTYQNKGSCVKGQPSLVGKGRIFEFSRKKINVTKNFFIRVFASAANFQDFSADQRVKVLQQPAPVVRVLCWKNCGRILKPQEILVLQLVCDTCGRYRWNTMLGSLNSCDFEVFCRIPAQFFIQMQKVKVGKRDSTPVFQVTATGFDQQRRDATATFHSVIALLPNTSRCEILPEGVGIAFITKYSITCPQNDGLTYKFSIKNADGTNPMLQYGYENTLHDLTVADVLTHITVTICNGTDSCFSETYTIKAKSAPAPTDLSTSTSIEVNDAIKSGDLQKIAAETATVLSRIAVSDELKMSLIEAAIETDFSSTESAKQISDILLECTKNKWHFSVDFKGIVLGKVYVLRNWIVEDTESSSELLSSAARGLLRVTSNIMEALGSEPSTTQLLHSAMEVVGDLGNKLLDLALPGKEHVVFSTPSFKGTLKTIARNKDATLKDENVELKFETDWKMIRLIDVVHLQVIRFNSSKTTFGSTNNHIQDVIGLSYYISYKTLGNAMLERDPLVPQHPVKYYLHGKREGAENSTELHFKIPYLSRDEHGLSVTIDGDVRDIVLNVRLVSQYIQDNIVLNIMLIRRKMNAYTHEFKQSIIIEGADFSLDEYTWRIPLTVYQGIYYLLIDAKVNGGALSGGDVVSFGLKVVTYTTTCQMWDGRTNAWRLEGCKATSGGTNRWDWCECDLRKASRYLRKPKSLNLLSSKLHIFSTDHTAIGSILPNETDSRSAARQSWAANITVIVNNVSREIMKNPMVLSVISSIFAIFGAVMIWAKLDDLKKRKSRLYRDACDNSPLEKYRYMLTVFTGTRRGAKPTSTIAMKVLGSNGSTVHVLQKFDADELPLKNNNVVSILFTTSECLGDISLVRIWQDGQGDNPNWFIDRMAVRDLETNECWFFLVRQWLRYRIPEDADKFLNLRPTSIYELNSFRNLFLIKISSHMKESHIWYSIFASRPWARYAITRVERVSCCMQLSLMIVLTSLLFYGRLVDESNQTGWFSLTNIAAGLGSGVLCSPVSYIIYVMFRSSKAPGDVTSNRSDCYLQPSAMPLERQDHAKCEQTSNTIESVTVTEIDPASGHHKRLPWFFRYLAWIITGLFSMGSTLLSILYGITYGYNETNKQWLVSLVFALLESIVILEPLKAIFLAYLAVVGHPRLDVSEWIVPFRKKAASKRQKNKKKILRLLEKERKEQPIYREPNAL